MTRLESPLKSRVRNLMRHSIPHAVPQFPQGVTMVMLRSCQWAAVLLFASVGLASEPGPDAKSPSAVEPVMAFTVHSAGVIGLAFTPDGKHIVSASPKDVRTWDVATTKEVAGTELSGGRVAAVAPDGKTVAFNATERVGLPVIVRAATDGKELLNIRPHSDVTQRTAFGSLVGALVFSPDGKRLATAGRSGLVGGPHGLPGGVVKVWDVATGEQLLHVPGPRPGVSTSAFAGVVAFSADAKYLAAGTDGAGGELPESGEVVVWDAADGKVILAIHVREEVKPGDFHSAVTAVALSPDGKWVAAAYGNRPARADGLLLSDRPTSALRIYEVATGRVVHTLLGHTASVGRLAFRPDGQQLASASADGTVRVWDAATGKQARMFSFEGGPPRALGFSLDGKLLAAGGGNNESGVVRVWPCPAE